ncbi:LacI family DNA-binding transcriptional regulator [Bifidobacterium simiarum]|nr:substrate-binding domain-containing protein [Bifidobacterium simiarum]MBT1166522.1 LacI family DNA-binding transcriptional regulator [Bifidobacterium simiarum]
MSLTVVESPGVDMGRRAMTLLLDEIDNPAGHVHSTQPFMPKLIRRASTR